MIKGTTIIVVILQGSIYIGADSRVHDISGRSIGTTCKLVQVGNAVAGVAVLLGDDATGWHTADLAKQALSRDGALDQKVGDFIARVRAQAEPLLSGVRRDDLALYQKEVVGKPFIQAVFIEDGELRQVTLEPVNDGARVALRSHFQSCDASCDQSYIALGHFDNLAKIVERTPNYWRAQSVTDQIRELIRVEERVDPNRTGGAISIAKLRQRVVTWIDRGACE